MLVVCLYFTLFIFIAPNVLCDKGERCDLSDEECITAANKILIKKAIAGNPVYKINSSDPLYQDKIEIFLPHMNVTFTKAYMYGTKSCEARRLRILTEDWYGTYVCPKMILQSDYEINGEVDPIHIEGKGRCEIIYGTEKPLMNVETTTGSENNPVIEKNRQETRSEDYTIIIHGGYETYVGESGKEFLNITHYEVDSRDIQGSVVYNFTNLFNGDSEQSVKVHDYINTDWRKLDSIIGKPIIHSLFGYFLNQLNKYLAIIPKQELFYTQL